jgi:threonine dehydratase
MAENAVPGKVAAIRSHGAEIRFRPTMSAAYEELERFRSDTGAVLVSPFADPEIIAGQGTVGLEILEDAPEVEQIVVAIGGGGLIAGIATAVKALKPDVRIVGVEPTGAPTVYASLRAGSPQRLAEVTTIADGLAAPFTAPLPLSIIQEQVDDVVLVSDDEIKAALVAILDTSKLLVEPAGAAATAALMTNKAAVPIGAQTVVVLSGGNVGLSTVKQML